MGLKQATRLDEGPLDFMRGAAGAAGQKIAQSGVGRAVGDVVNAGKQASAIGNLQQQIMQFAKTVAMIDKLKQAEANVEVQGDRQEPTMDKPADQQQDAAPQSGGVAQAFRTQGKPRGRQGKYGPEWTFDSFLRTLYSDEQKLDEGVMDFMKGAAGAAWGKAAAAVKEYGDRPSIVKDLYHAGKAASDAGNARRTEMKSAEATQTAMKQLEGILAQIKALGPQAGKQAIMQATQKMGPQGQRIAKMIMVNAGKRGIKL